MNITRLAVSEFQRIIASVVTIPIDFTGCRAMAHRFQVELFAIVLIACPLAGAAQSVRTYTLSKEKTAKILSRAKLNRGLGVLKPQELGADNTVVKLPDSVSERPRIWALPQENRETKNWAGAPNAISNDGRAYQLELKPGQIYFMQHQAAEHKEAAKLQEDTALSLGGLYYSRRTNDGNTSLLQWDLSLMATVTPATWDPQYQAYTTNLMIGFKSADENSEAAPALKLKPPIKVRFTSEDCRLSSMLVEIGETGIDGFKNDIVLTSDRHNRKPKITAIANEGETEAIIKIGPEISQLNLDITKSSILALGLAETTLIVTRLAEDGQPLESAKALDVNLQADAGLFPATLQIPANFSSIETSLRSSGVGQVNVTIRTASGIAVTKSIEFVFPWLLLAIVLLTGAAGGGIRLIPRKKDSQDQSSERNCWIVVLGSFTAALTVSAATIGINLIPAIPPEIVSTEIGAFFVAGLSGYTGSPMLDALRKRVFPLKA
jgi:hypothetical protein